MVIAISIVPKVPAVSCFMSRFNVWTVDRRAEWLNRVPRKCNTHIQASKDKTDKWVSSETPKI